MLIVKITRIIKNNYVKTKQEYEDILKDNMDIKKRIKSTINTQIEKIKQILNININRTKY